jgi:hypothetical protein
MKIYNSFQELATDNGLTNTLAEPQRSQAIQDVNKAGDMIYRSAQKFQGNGEEEAGKMLYALEDQVNQAQQRLEARVSNSFPELSGLSAYNPKNMEALRDAFVEIGAHAGNYGFLGAETAALEGARIIEERFGDEMPEYGVGDDQTVLNLDERSNRALRKSLSKAANSIEDAMSYTGDGLTLGDVGGCASVIMRAREAIEKAASMADQSASRFGYK